MQVVAYLACFLICVAVFAKARKRKLRQALLLIISYALYGTWTRWFVAVLLASTVLNFLVGKWLQRKPSAIVLWIGILCNLALLSTFKYLPEISVAGPFSSLRLFSHLTLPLGISFWTFQAMSYLFDLYRGEELDPSFFEFALYLAFFPITISGPVCRLPDMLPQFRSEETTSWIEVGLGFRRVAIGILMMQLAKLLGQGVLAGNGIHGGFDRLSNWSGADVWCLAVGYGLQLFFDFAGYSHIAIGAARALGICVPDNFERPFSSTTPSVFWTRWHMSLSFWIRDYVFFPLATLRREIWWRNLALVISMVLFGLWHKATLLFLLWGAYHGLLLVIHRLLQRFRHSFNWNAPAKLWTPLSWIATMLSINLGWIFFRANSTARARQMLEAVLSASNYRSHFIPGSLYVLVAGLALGYAITLLVSNRLDHYVNQGEAFKPDSSAFVLFAIRWRWYWIASLYTLALLFVLLVNSTGSANTAQMMYGNF